MRIIDIDNELILDAKDKIYNPAIFEQNGRIYLCFRFEPTKTFETNLGVVELDNNFIPITKSVKFLVIPRCGGNVRTLDDPRCFFLDGKLHILHAQGALTPTGGWTNCQVIAPMSQDFVSERPFLLDYGKNINYSNRGHDMSCEKNWTPLIHRNKLRMIYKIEPLEMFEVYYEEFDANPKVKPLMTQNKVLGLEWGWPSGGTPLVRRGDEYWGIFHSHVKNEDHIRDYYMGFYAISVEEPHRVTKISRKPILEADWGSKHDLRNVSQGWVPNCIFPCGMIERGGKVYISYGWQDCRCKILETTYEELNENAREIVYN